MFTKLLNWLFGKRRKKKLSPKPKHRVSKLVNKTKGDTAEKTQNKKTKRRTKKMADEKEVKEEKVETEKKVEPEKNTSAEKETEATKPVAEEQEVEKTEKTETTDEVKPTEEVAETQDNGNAVRVEDLVTKEMLKDMFAALEAKIDAVVKENGDLKNAIADKDSELKGVKERYETPDFGNAQKQGVQVKDQKANELFDEYSKQFM